MCCEPIPASPEDTVAHCHKCAGEIDREGRTTEEGCVYSPVACQTCGWQPCDQSC